MESENRNTFAEMSPETMSPDKSGIDMSPPLPELTQEERIFLMNLLSWFIIEDAPANTKITEGQLHIFAGIVLRKSHRIQIICSTQYGKSLTLALACIVLSCIFKKMVVIVAPSAEKAKIIMRYYIDHLGDNPIFATKLEKNSRLERLKQEESKSRIKLNNGGGIFVISTDEKNSKKSIESAMGQGAEIVIGDEFCLVSDNTEATIFRMIAGKGPDACYIKVGNPFYRMPPYSHFYNTWLQINTYQRIFVDYKQALKEGRYSHSFIDESRSKPHFDVLYECKFPEIGTMDQDGYKMLIKPEEIKFGINPQIILNMMEKQKAENNGKLKTLPKLGCDIGGGGDLNVRVLRWGKYASVVGQNKSNDTMVNVVEIENDMKTYGIRAEDVNVDDIGVGRGVSDRLKEKGHAINSVNVGGPAVFDPERFTNLKAELCWNAGLTVADPESRFDKREEWGQLTWLRYKTISDRKIQMEPKEKLKARTKKSPDVAEAFYLTFAEKPFVGFA